MITQPNQFTLSENGVTYGLHTFKDGINPTVICQLHASGEWITLAPATEKQVKQPGKVVPATGEGEAGVVAVADDPEQS
jgi:hypothetical protein